MHVGVKHAMRHTLITNWGSGALWHWTLWDAERGVGEAAAKSLWEAAQKDVFISADDISNRAGVSKSVIEMLRTSGALGDLPETSQVSFF